MSDVEKKMDVQAWKRDVFMPWKEAVAKYNDEKLQQANKLRAHAGQLETIVALLMEGKTKNAMLAWNTLELHPKLKDIKLGDDGDTLRLVDNSGEVTVLRLEDLIDDLQRLMEMPAPVVAPAAS